MSDEFVFDFVVNQKQAGFLESIVVEKGGIIYEVPPFHEGPIKHIKAIIKTLKKNRKSIIHCNLGEKSVFYLFFSWLFGYKKRILHVHSSVRPEKRSERRMRTILSFFCKIFATDYFACGEEAAKWFYGYKRQNVFIMRNAIQLSEYSFSEDLRRKYRVKYGLENKLVIGNVGRLSPPKNHDYMINVFQSLIAINENACLVLVGAGELEEKIKEKIHSKGIEQSVLMLGLLDNVNEILNCFDLFLLPSISEGVPVAAVEALANGLVVVCSDSVTKEIQVRDRVLYLSLKQSPSYWADAINSLNPQREIVTTELSRIGFDIDRQVLALEKEYLQIRSKSI